MIYHTVEETVEIAERIRATPDAEMQRAATGLSLKAICSLAILTHQLDEICRAAAAVPMSLDQAAFVMTPPELALFAVLRQRLVAAGYLTLEPQEAGHGQS